MFHEDYKIITQENLSRPFSIKAEHLSVRRLDGPNLVVVSTVMAQTVALDYYAAAVDKMMTKFMHINQSIQITNKVGVEARTSLNKLVAQNIAVNVAVVSELGIFEGNDATWVSTRAICALTLTAAFRRTTANTTWCGRGCGRTSRSTTATKTSRRSCRSSRGTPRAVSSCVLAHCPHHLAARVGSTLTC